MLGLPKSPVGAGANGARARLLPNKPVERTGAPKAGAPNIPPAGAWPKVDAGGFPKVDVGALKVEAGAPNGAGAGVCPNKPPPAGFCPMPVGVAPNVGAGVDPNKPPPKVLVEVGALPKRPTTAAGAGAPKPP